MTSQTRPEAVTFDFWGTLYDNQEADSLRIALLQERLQVDAPIETAYESAHQLAHQYWETARRPFPAAERLDATLEALGVHVCQDARAKLVTDLEEALLQIPPEPVRNVRRLLCALRDRSIRIGLISDTGITPGRVLRAIMARDELLPYFEHCTFSDELGRTKPDPLPFRHTLEALRTCPCRATHIGDLPDTDVAGAKEVGMRAVLFTGVTDYQGAAHQADALLTNYDDLEAALRAIGAE